MAYTESTMMALGTKAPAFTLPDTVSGKNVTLYDTSDAKATLIMFICNHCPYVIHVNPELVRIAKYYKPKGLRIIAISSNDVSRYPADSPEKMKETAEEVGYTFPYLYDETQEVARDYDAACTPDFYLFDPEMKLAYRGRLDDSKPNSGKPLTGKDLREAIDTVLEGGKVSEVQYPSGGCGIKWKINN